jgi:hypothetical protein
MNESPLPPPVKSRPQIHPIVWLGAAIVLIAIGLWMFIGRQKGHSKHTTAQASPTPAAAAADTSTPLPASAGSPEPTAASPATPASGKSLALGSITSEDVPDESAATRFVLHIPIKALPGAAIDVKALVIHVLFYDIVDGTKVSQTNATVSSRWATPPADWTKADTQMLDVSYQLPKADLRLHTSHNEDRRYYGYVVRLYYEDQLQDAAATPEQLAERFPPAPTLSAATAKNAEASEPSSFDISTAKPPKSPSATPAATPGAYAGPKTLDLFPVKVDKIADASAAKHLLLHIPIKARRGAPIEVKDVVIHVLFYDIIDAKKVVQTGADVKTRWATPPADWVQSEVEELDAEYVLPKPGPSNGSPPEARDYYGYIVRIYYKGNLQTATADPERLAQEYPPPQTINQETSAATPPAQGGSTETGTARPKPEEVAAAGPPDFVTQARKLRENAVEHMEPEVSTPTEARALAARGRYPWKTQIVTTMFAVGYGKKGHVPHKTSAWDPQWLSHYGGIDSPNPAKRHNFIPTAFTPRENPFYIALPYNDVEKGATKPEAKIVIPWYREVSDKGDWAEGRSICRQRWLAVRSAAGRVCYAQWSDCGPFATDHWQYVFGNEKPRPNLDGGAGLQISPAVRDYLELGNMDVTDWKFVEAKDVPDGPWKIYGEHGAHTPNGRGHGPILMASAAE